jgi:NAD(P)-dependent dehydrogenase (short-subunit alcohol dehydrogenase family)
LIRVAALAKAGADLVITSRVLRHLAVFEAEIKAIGKRALSLELDVCDLASIRKMVAAAEAFYGRLDILVNNAGCNIRKPALMSHGRIGTAYWIPTCVAVFSSLTTLRAVWWRGTTGEN